MSRRDFGARRRWKRLTRTRPDKVILMTEHPMHQTPFVVFLWKNQGTLRVEELPGGELKFHAFTTGSKGAGHDIAPEEWPDPVCAWMAETALTEGDQR